MAGHPWALKGVGRVKHLERKTMYALASPSGIAGCVTHVGRERGHTHELVVPIVPNEHVHIDIWVAKPGSTASSSARGWPCQGRSAVG
jgi:hypothetical protein